MAWILAAPLMEKRKRKLGHKQDGGDQLYFTTFFRILIEFYIHQTIDICRIIMNFWPLSHFVQNSVQSSVTSGEDWPRSWFCLIKLFLTPRFGQAVLRAVHIGLKLVSLTTCVRLTVRYPTLGTVAVIIMILLMD